jgi:methyl-accepting chemotaxis protein
MAAHTSPVYVEVADRPIGSPEDAETIATIIDGNARWIETMAAIADPATRARMVETISAAARSLRRGAAKGDGGTW